jgi:hypothetical protein
VRDYEATFHWEYLDDTFVLSAPNATLTVVGEISCAEARQSRFGWTLTENKASAQNWHSVDTACCLRPFGVW